MVLTICFLASQREETSTCFILLKWTSNARCFWRWCGPVSLSNLLSTELFVKCWPAIYTWSVITEKWFAQNSDCSDSRWSPWTCTIPLEGKFRPLLHIHNLWNHSSTSRGEAAWKWDRCAADKRHVNSKLHKGGPEKQNKTKKPAKNCFCSATEEGSNFSS